MPWLIRKLTPKTGLNAASTLRFCATCQAPPRASAMNQTTVIGPKKVATRAVPRDCTANRANRIITESGTT